MSDTSVTIKIEELANLRDAVLALSNEVTDLRASRSLTQVWFTGKEACEMKGVPWNTLRQAQFSYLLPNFGRSKPIMKRGRCHAMYHRTHVFEWLEKTQEQIEREYAAFKRSKSA